MITNALVTPVRVIARLDIKGPNLIKGMQFDGHRVLGSPEYFAQAYNSEGVDELIFQDSVASLYCRNSLNDIIRKTADEVFIPITVAGGIRTIEDISECLKAGADKVAINTGIVNNPDFLRQAVETFGSQCIVASLEVYRHDYGFYEIWTDYGRETTSLNAIEWAQKVAELGAGEIMLTSINNEGMGRGYDIELTNKIASLVTIPVIAVGGASNAQDIVNVIQQGHADAVAAASIFHYCYQKKVDSLQMAFNEPRLRMGEQIDSGNIDFLKEGYGGFRELVVKPTSIADVKKELIKNNIPTRIVESVDLEF